MLDQNPDEKLSPTKMLYERFRNELEKNKIPKGRLAKKFGISSQAFSTKIYNSKLVDLDFIYECVKYEPSINIIFVLTGNVNNSNVEEFNLNYEKQLERQRIIIEYLTDENSRIRNSNE